MMLGQLRCSLKTLSFIKMRKYAFDFRVIAIGARRVIRAIGERPIVELYVEVVFFYECFYAVGKAHRLS